MRAPLHRPFPSSPIIDPPFQGDSFHEQKGSVALSNYHQKIFMKSTSFDDKNRLMRQSLFHATGLVWEKQSGIKLLHVPYKGAADSMNALLGG